MPSVALLSRLAAPTPQPIARLRATSMLTRLTGVTRSRGGKAARRIAVVLAILIGLAGGTASASRPLDPALFPAPPQLEANVLFWTDVYSRYDSHRVVIHDNVYLDIVYTVLDFSELDRQDISDAAKASSRADRVERALASYADILRDLAGSPSPGATISASERRDVETMFRRVSGGDGKYLAAVDRLRAQTGLADKFEGAIRRSGRYMPEIERIFRTRGLPIELSRLPFVESMFQDRARSKVGAGGIWQFMPSTGRLYLRIRRELDERWDPFAASDGAARLLADNYERLGSWPLALTAYNHGAAGMARAASQLATTDLGVIAWNYDSRSFGFASRNFYAEFLAAVSVYENRAIHFPGVVPDAALAFDELVVSKPISIRTLADRTGTSVDSIEDLNLGLTSGVLAGKYPLPAGYRLRVPEGSRGVFLAALESAAPAVRTASAPATRTRTHVVARGETVSQIAARYDVPTNDLLRANGLRPSSRIRQGQRLRVPTTGSGEDTPEATLSVVALAEPESTPSASQPSQPADAAPRLVAKRSSTPSTARAAASANPIDTASAAPAASRTETHLVARGETLSSIAARYGTTAQAIQAANGLRKSSQIKAGQTLRIDDAAEAAPTLPAAPPPAVAKAERDTRVSRAESARAEPRKPVTHKVKRGETLVEIASRYGTSVTDLKKENRLRGPTIQPNQLLRIPRD